VDLQWRRPLRYDTQQVSVEAVRQRLTGDATRDSQQRGDPRRTEIAVHWVGHRVQSPITAIMRSAREKLYKVLRLSNRQSPEQNLIQQSKDRRIGSNAERKRGNRDRRKQPHSLKTPNRDADIGDQVRHRFWSEYLKIAKRLPF
jgi:hypothetical protein